MYQWIIMCEILCWAGTLSKTHDKAGQPNDEMKDRFVDNIQVH